MHTFTVEIEREEDGRFIAEIVEIPGALAYGSSRDDALGKAQAIALRALAERLENGQTTPDLSTIQFRAA